MVLGVELADGADDEFLLSLLVLLLDPLIVLLGELCQILNHALGVLLLLLVVAVLQRVAPVDLVQVEKHLLLKFVLPVVHRNRVVVFAEAMGDGNKRGLLDVPNVGSCLSRLNAHHDDLRVNAAEGVNDNLTLD